MVKISFIFFLSVFPFLLSGQIEVCDNGIDDDNDGLIDFNDDDCTCDIVSSVSLITNPSFEELDCCPSDKSQLNCATGWEQASAPTTDLAHLCDWAGVDDYPPPLPFPDGEAVLGFRDGRLSSSDPLDAFWKEYAGACLKSPMLADTLYRFEFDLGFVDAEISPPINVTLFGTSSCDNLPFGVGDVAFGCPTNSPEWKRLGDVRVDGGSGDTWVKAFIDVVPDEDILAIAIGPDCDPVPSDNVIYYYFDNFRLVDLASFDLQITERLHPCNPNFTLSIPENTDFEYQWYLSGVALSGETAPQLSQNYEAGAYQVRILSGISCRISATYNYAIPVYNGADTIAICEGESYTFGDQVLTTSGSYQHTFMTDDACDSIVELELEVIGQTYDTIEKTIAPGEVFEIGDNSYTDEGEYTLSVPSALMCDSLLLLKLSHYQVYIPNVFSPNADGLTDGFQPQGALSEVTSYDMKIFDRWGNLIFQGEVWDGSDYPTDIYVYIIEVKFVNGKTSPYYGSLTLLR